MRILIVEDDDSVADALIDCLRRHGHDVESVQTGQAALDHDGSDLVLLDLGLPDLDGQEVCRRLRAESDVPIIVISARSDEVDRVLCLHLGADDYMVKPFGLRELVARIEAVSRRSMAASFAVSHEPSHPVEVAEPDDVAAPVLRVGKLSLDHRQRHAFVNDVRLRLTRKEFDLLALLMEDPGAVFTRETLLDRVWDINWFGSTRTLDSHVSSLRAKLGDPGWVETVRGVGFRLIDPDRPA
ncbi:MAG: response regulator transcription factor [Stackebrandtia sp.]